MRPLYRIVFAASVAWGAVACGGTPGGPLPPFFTDGPVAAPGLDGGAPPVVDSAGHHNSDAPPPKPGVCPSLAGGWGGPLAGTITGLSSVAVTGSVTLILAAAQAQGDYTIISGEWVTAPKSAPSLQAKQPISGGTVHCGKLSINTAAVIFGVKTAGAFACTFVDGSGCKGTWSGKATDGSSSAGAGTFELRRK